MPLSFRIMPTRLGELAYLIDDHGLRRVYLPHGGPAALRAAVHTEFPTAGEDLTLAPPLANQFRRYFEGEPLEFKVDLSLDADGISDFRRAVWLACHAIPYGNTATYGELAERVGRPGAARAVGTAMRCNPCPIVIPCHRVLGCHNTIGGYSGPGGIDFKRRLLEMESTPHT